MIFRTETKTNNRSGGATPLPECRGRKGLMAGFTLMELLIVISLIGLLASLIVVATNSARIQSRDAKRREDALVIRTALQWYFYENGEYPNRGALGNPNNEIDIQNLYSFLSPKYMSKLPDDPKKYPENYKYVWKNNGKDYGLYIPFGNDGRTSCKFITEGGSANWFGKAVSCWF